MLFYNLLEKFPQKQTKKKSVFREGQNAKNFVRLQRLFSIFFLNTCCHSSENILKSMSFFMFTVNSLPFFAKHEKLECKLTTVDSYTRLPSQHLERKQDFRSKFKSCAKFSTFLCFQEMDLESTR